MSQKMKLLIIEDAEDDALLMVYKLTSAGFALNWKRIQSEPELLRELREPWDLIISDYSVPNYSALNGLLIVRDLYPDTPFIIVSGAIGEEAAVELMKNGADDYLLKDNLGKLPQVIRRELDDYKLKVAKRKAENELRASEERYSLALNSSEEGIWDWNLGTGAKNFSPGYFQMLGIEIETDPAPPDFKYELIHPADKNNVMSAIRDCIRGDKTNYMLEYRVKHADGNWIWILGKCRVVNRNSDGSAARMVGTNMDITRSKNTEIERRESEERLRTLVDTIPDGILMVGLNYIVKWVNKNLLGLLHFDEYGEVIGKNIFPQVCFDTQRKGQPLFTKCLNSGETRSAEFELGRLNGTRIFVEMTVSLIKNYHGEPENFLVVIKDITNRKSYESMIKKFSVAINSSTDTIMITDASGKIEYVNPSFEKIYGYTLDEVMGKTPRMLKSDKYNQDFYLKLWATILAGKIFRAEIVNKNKGGELVMEDRIISPINDEKGEIVSFISIGRDISEKINAEKSMKASKQKLLGIFNQPHLCLAFVTVNGELTDINESFINFIGLKEGIEAGNNFFDSVESVVSTEVKQHLVSAMEAAVGNKPHSFIWRQLYSDGNSAEAEFSVLPVRDESGEIALFLIQGYERKPESQKEKKGGRRKKDNDFVSGTE